MKNNGKLVVTTPSDREIAMTRVFDAPRGLVFEAYTKPDLVKRWLGVFENNTMETCEIDLRVGGTYRYVWHTPHGEMGMGGVYQKIAKNERIVCTEVFDQKWYEGEAIDTITFEERASATTVTTTVRYATKEARDAVLKSPMEHGVAAGCDALEALLATMPNMAKPSTTIPNTTIDEPQIVSTKEQATAVIHLTVPNTEVRKVMGPGLKELMATLKSQGITPTGRWFTHHLKLPSDTFDFEIGVPVDQPVKAEGRVKPGILPAVTAARTIHRGKYEGLGAAWGALGRWIESKEQKAQPWLWETYTTDPEKNPDDSTWETELTRPLFP